MKTERQRLGILFGNRDFFPDRLVTDARSDVEKVCREEGIDPVMLDEGATKLGGVETYADAIACANLFKEHAETLDGIWVCLPNFGDEKGVLEAIRQSKLDLPILVQGYPDELSKLSPALRRDSFCGKISVCNNLTQAGIPFSLTKRHVVHPESPEFRKDLRHFLGVCRVVNGLKGLRIGAVGARPSAFNTVRYSEKLLERNGISVTTVDLSEILGRAEKLDGNEPEVKETIEKFLSYAAAPGVPQEKLVQMARLDLALREWMSENAIQTTAIQCWTSLQQNWGCNVCSSMSMMSEQFNPSACEVDVTGALTMYAMQLACNSPAALVDWNNNYGDEEDKCVLFHCGNWAKHFQPEGTISKAPILGSTLGEENTYGAMDGRTPANPLTYGRITTSDAEGRIKAYLGQGKLTDDSLKTFGNRAVAEVPQLAKLMQHVCRNGFEHHVVMTLSQSADILKEAFETYMGWETYLHGSSD